MLQEISVAVHMVMAGTTQRGSNPHPRVCSVLALHIQELHQCFLLAAPIRAWHGDRAGFQHRRSPEVCFSFLSIEEEARRGLGWTHHGWETKTLQVSQAKAESAPLISQVRPLPTFKRDKRGDLDNYGPVSSASIPRRLIEWLTWELINKELKASNISK